MAALLDTIHLSDLRLNTMLKKFLNKLGLGSAPSGPTAAANPYHPYAEPHVNFLYNLLFCDDLALFKQQGNASETGFWSALMAEQIDASALRQIADDQTLEGRVRALAYHRLRTAGESVPEKILLGVIVEVPLEKGLDVLAAFTGGSVRYLNQSGRVGIFEGQGNPVEALATELLAVSQPVVDQIGPWDKQRPPPPKVGNLRISFLVSDGLYFGEGPFEVLSKDGMAAPVLAKATELLQRAVAIGTQ